MVDEYFDGLHVCDVLAGGDPSLVVQNKTRINANEANSLTCTGRIASADFVDVDTRVALHLERGKTASTDTISLALVGNYFDGSANRYGGRSALLGISRQRKEARNGYTCRRVDCDLNRLFHRTHRS